MQALSWAIGSGIGTWLGIFISAILIMLFEGDLDWEWLGRALLVGVACFVIVAALVFGIVLAFGAYGYTFSLGALHEEVKPDAEANFCAFAHEGAGDGADGVVLVGDFGGIAWEKGDFGGEDGVGWEFFFTGWEVGGLKHLAGFEGMPEAAAVYFNLVDAGGNDCGIGKVQEEVGFLAVVGWVGGGNDLDGEFKAMAPVPNDEVGNQSRGDANGEAYGGGYEDVGNHGHVPVLVEVG